ncbi:hypothetical protein BN159_0700 [Streptomyces davaonensis JCM 4913]|uniref:Uncharacterized protein n=1 Tax=Streptomyces davaonensis (strain DSM 101723 / JCM 4913 / KCC S-0913 / 768) TaxID=1214101 RepID=K4QXH6_STRDJ|nr:hypothetical protein [Streptomyces davaonensis]CCK25079.1 hypothetical protein BN159_0700 [Streptomyces davaonensis JCM 4913]
MPHQPLFDEPGTLAETHLTRPRRAMAPLAAPAADVLRIVSDPRTPVFVTAMAGGRLRYGYWRAAGSGGGVGGCHVALPTDVCEELRSAGRITLGAPVSDPGKTTYRVSAVGAEAGRERVRAA